MTRKIAIGLLNTAVHDIAPEMCLTFTLKKGYPSMLVADLYVTALVGITLSEVKHNKKPEQLTTLVTDRLIDANHSIVSLGRESVARLKKRAKGTVA